MKVITYKCDNCHNILSSDDIFMEHLRISGLIYHVRQADPMFRINSYKIQGKDCVNPEALAGKQELHFCGGDCLLNFIPEMNQKGMENEV